jgi:hypothetical protein
MNLTTAQRGILGRMARDNAPILAHISRQEVICCFPRGRHRLNYETVAALEQADCVRRVDYDVALWQWKYEITEAGRNAIRNN